MDLTLWNNADTIDQWLNTQFPSKEPDDTSTHQGPPRGTGKRKGHRKSRGGCLNCKARKIKCSESRPICNHCSRGNLICRYASDLNRSDQNTTATSTLQRISLQNVPTLFTMLDMRAFHHFLIGAHPHLPLGMDDAWITEVPRIAHHHEYLMHAILSLGASHLSLISPQEAPQRTEGHRLRAVKGLNEAMSKDLTKVSDSDVDGMLATAYILTFENAFTGSSIAEFFTLVRGCASITVQIVLSGKNSTLRPANAPNHIEIMKPKMIDGQIPIVDYFDAQDALDALNQLYILPMKPYQVDIFNHFTRIAFLAQTSSSAAYFEYIKFYDVITGLESAQFQDLIDPNEPVSLLIHGYFLAIETLVGPLVSLEVQKPLSAIPGRSTINVFQKLLDPRFPFLTHHLSWPIQFCAKTFGAEIVESQSSKTLQCNQSITRDSKLVDAPYLDTSQETGSSSTPLYEEGSAFRLPEKTLLRSKHSNALIPTIDSDYIDTVYSELTPSSNSSNGLLLQLT